MTLFRKVFQSQARSPEDGEMPDPDHPGAQITSMPEQPCPLVLDKKHEVDGGADDVPDNQNPLEVEDQMMEPEHEASDQLGKVSEDACNTTHEVDPEKDAMASGVSNEPSADIVAIMEKTATVADQETAGKGEDSLNFGEESLSLQEEVGTDSPLEEDKSSDSHADVDATENRLGDEYPFVAPDLATAPDLEAVKSDPAAFARQQMEALALSVQEKSELQDEQAGDGGGQAGTSFPDLSKQVGVPASAAGRTSRRAGRVKTRLLGFNRDAEPDGDPFLQVADSTATPQREKFPVGWLVIVEGPGIGHAFSMFTGASTIGRGEGQMIRLDFGDNSISRQNHAAVAYDEEVNKFYIGHGGKSNIIRRNARPVLSTEELHHADLLRIGETTLRFVALCGTDFQWNVTGAEDVAGI